MLNTGVYAWVPMVDANSSLLQHKKIKDAAKTGNKIPTRQHIRAFPLCMKGLPIFLDEWVKFNIAQPFFAVIATDVLSWLIENEDD